MQKELDQCVGGVVCVFDYHICIFVVYVVLFYRAEGLVLVIESRGPPSEAPVPHDWRQDLKDESIWAFSHTLACPRTCAAPETTSINKNEWMLNWIISRWFFSLDPTGWVCASCCLSAHTAPNTICSFTQSFSSRQKFEALLSWGKLMVLIYLWGWKWERWSSWKRFRSGMWC